MLCNLEASRPYWHAFVVIVSLYRQSICFAKITLEAAETSIFFDAEPYRQPPDLAYLEVPSDKVN